MHWTLHFHHAASDLLHLVDEEQTSPTSTACSVLATYVQVVCACPCFRAGTFRESSALHPAPKLSWSCDKFPISPLRFWCLHPEGNGLGANKHHRAHHGPRAVTPLPNAGLGAGDLGWQEKRWPCEQCCRLLLEVEAHAGSCLGFVLKASPVSGFGNPDHTDKREFVVPSCREEASCPSCMPCSTWMCFVKDSQRPVQSPILTKKALFKII